MSVRLAGKSAVNFLNNFRFTQHGITTFTKHGNKHCRALEILKKIWTCLTFIQLYSHLSYSQGGGNKRGGVNKPTYVNHFSFQDSPPPDPDAALTLRLAQAAAAAASSMGMMGGMMMMTELNFQDRLF